MATAMCSIEKLGAKTRRKIEEGRVAPETLDIDRH